VIKNDTIKIKKDTILKPKLINKVERIIKIEKTETITTTKIDYLEKILENPGSLFWILFLVFFCFKFSAELKNLLQAITSKIHQLKSLNKDGGLFDKGIVPEEKAISIEQKQPSKEEIKNAVIFNPMEKKIMSTLWIHQKETFPDFKERWSFTLVFDAIKNNNELFLTAVEKLMDLGLVRINLENKQYFLTRSGIDYCLKNEASLGNFSFFKDFDPFKI